MKAVSVRMISSLFLTVLATVVWDRPLWAAVAPLMGRPFVVLPRSELGVPQLSEAQQIALDLRIRDWANNLPPNGRGVREVESVDREFVGLANQVWRLRHETPHSFLAQATNLKSQFQIWLANKNFADHAPQKQWGLWYRALLEHALGEPAVANRTLVEAMRTHPLLEWGESIDSDLFPIEPSRVFWEFVQGELLAHRAPLSCAVTFVPSEREPIALQVSGFRLPWRSLQYFQTGALFSARPIYTEGIGEAIELDCRKTGKQVVNLDSSPVFNAATSRDPVLLTEVVGPRIGFALFDREKVSFSQLEASRPLLVAELLEDRGNALPSFALAVGEGTPDLPATLQIETPKAKAWYNDYKVWAIAGAVTGVALYFALRSDGGATTNPQASGLKIRLP